MVRGYHESHQAIRFSDSSQYDEVCDHCGQTDADIGLEQPCTRDRIRTPKVAVGSRVTVYMPSMKKHSIGGTDGVVTEVLPGDIVHVARHDGQPLAFSQPRATIKHRYGWVPA